MNRFWRVIGIVVMLLMLIPSMGSAVLAEEGNDSSPPEVSAPNEQGNGDAAGGPLTDDDAVSPTEGPQSGEGKVDRDEGSDEPSGADIGGEPASQDEQADSDSQSGEETVEIAEESGVLGTDDASSEGSTEKVEAGQQNIGLLQDTYPDGWIVDARCDGTMVVRVSVGGVGMNGDGFRAHALRSGQTDPIGDYWEIGTEPGLFSHDFWHDSHPASTSPSVRFVLHIPNEHGATPIIDSWEIQCDGGASYDVEQFDISCAGVLTVRYGDRAPSVPLYKVYNADTGALLGEAFSTPLIEIQPGEHDSLRAVVVQANEFTADEFVAETTVSGCLDEDPQPEFPTIVTFTVDMPDACAVLGGGATVSGTSQLSGPLPEDHVGATITVGWETPSGEVLWGHAHDGLMPSWSMREFEVNGPWSITMPPWDPEIRPNLFGPDRPGDATAFFARLELAEYVAGAEPLDSETIRIPMDSCVDPDPDPNPIDVIVQTIIRIILEILARLNA